MGDQGTTGTVVAGNFAGLDATGTIGVGNTSDGIFVNNALNVLVGTNGNGVADDIERNVVSGNGASGVFVGLGSIGVRVSGNIAGLNAAGTSAIANGLAGVWVGVASNTIVGTNGDGVGDAAERNIVSGNAWDGVRLTDSATQVQLLQVITWVPMSTALAVSKTVLRA